MPSHLRQKTRYRVAAFKPATRVSIALAAVMISLGIFAVVVPSAAGLYGALVGAAYALGGVYLAVNPTLEWEPLILVLSAIFLAEGILEFVLFFELRARPRSAWILFNSLTAVILGSVIWRTSLAASTSAVGLITGVNLFVGGFSRLMQSTFARRPLRLVALSE